MFGSGFTNLITWLRLHALAWTTSAAVSMVALRMVTPSFVDFIFDILTVVLVWIAAKLAKV